MGRTNLTHKDRALAAVSGVSPTPAVSPTTTPSRHSSTSSAPNGLTSTIVLPRAAYLIIFVEGCERFCYYGLKTVLLLYFIQFIGLSKDSATSGFHIFSFACYFTPTLGAIISDGYIGRYWTIFSLSIVYFLGTVVLTVTSIPSVGGKHLLGPFFGLLLIAIGTGGIKPCVNTFGADQISMSNPKQLSRYFAFFYFAINTGSLASTVLTPILRSDVTCFGYDCYMLAFGLPSLLMLIAMILFVIGTPLYKRKPPTENIIKIFVSIIWRAIRNAIFGSPSAITSSIPKQHWLYHADDKYSAADIEDVRCVLRVFLLFTPIPVFYALFDQQGSRWTYQASLMDGSLGDLGTIQPDQMQALNSLFVLLMIPFFEEVVYPVAARYNWLIRPLQRMFFGMLVMVLAFIVAAILQISIEAKSKTVPIRYESKIFNGLNCPVFVKYNVSAASIDTGSTLSFPCTKLVDEELYFESSCSGGMGIYKLSADKICPSVIIVSNIDENNQTIKITPLTNPITRERGQKGFGLLRLVSFDGSHVAVKTMPNEYKYTLDQALVPTDYQPVLATTYQIENLVNGQQSINSFEIHRTGVYTLLLYNTSNHELRTKLFEDVPPYTVHILWQTIQYFLITCSEMLVSVTGLIFAYSQAPRRYKSVIMSAWLLTTAFGDLIVVMVAEARFVEDQAMEFLLFALLMAFAAFIFGVLASRYKDRQATQDDDEVFEDQNLILDKDADDVDEAIPLSK